MTKSKEQDKKDPLAPGNMTPEKCRQIAGFLGLIEKILPEWQKEHPELVAKKTMDKKTLPLAENQKILENWANQLEEHKNPLLLKEMNSDRLNKLVALMEFFDELFEFWVKIHPEIAEKAKPHLVPENPGVLTIQDDLRTWAKQLDKNLPESGIEI